ncbi:MAG: hypothetical protein ACK501_16995 [Planctomycetota bacterium]
MSQAIFRRTGLFVATGALFFASCSTTSRAPVGAGEIAPGEPLRLSTDVGAPTRAPVVKQDAAVPMSQVHPRTMATLGFVIGEQDFEVNNGARIVSGSNDAYGFVLKGEHFLESDLGFHVSINRNESSKIRLDDGVNPVVRGDVTSTNIFLGLAYRATVDDKFRLPVRFGPFFNQSEQEIPGSADGDIERSSLGVRLAAEPEYIVFQHSEDGKVRELSLFAEFGCGAGPAKVKDNADSEDAYAFNFNWEVGARYRMPSGLLVGLSYMAMKNHYGTTESYNNAVFFGVDDDFGGFMVTAGLRF